MQNSSNKTFSYIPNGTSKIFPIDYSLRELAKKWGKDQRTVKKYLFKNGFLQKPLLDLTVKLDKAYQKESPLPLEAEPFFKVFFKAVTSSPLHKSLYKGNKPKPALKSFYKQLYSDLFKTICIPRSKKAGDPFTFCRHILLQNNKFNSAVMRQQWNEQIMVRVGQIQKLSEKVAAEQQAEILQDCLLALDHICVELIRAGQACPNCSDNVWPRPSDLLSDLLSYRRDMYADEKKYYIDNIDVSIDVTLEDAFKKLNCTKNPNVELMEQARNSYRVHLENSVLTSDFEEKVMELLNYIGFSENDWEEEALARKIAEIMRQECIPTICECCCYPYSQLQEAQRTKDIPYSYFDAFLTRKSKFHIQEEIKKYRDAVKYVRTVSEFRSRFDDLFAYQSVLPPDFWKQKVKLFEMEFNRSIVPVFYKWFTQVTNSSINSEVWTAFLKEGDAAVAYFGHDASLVLACNNFVNSHGHDNATKRDLDAIGETYIKGIYIILRHLVEDTSLKVAQNIKILHQYRQTKK